MTIAPKDQQPNGWIGVDLDGTLAVYDRWRGRTHIGEPVPRMLWHVKNWMREGKDVRLFTARLTDDPEGKVEEALESWMLQHLGFVLPVTCVKDYRMLELWDDRAVQVEKNMGVTVEEKLVVAYEEIIELREKVEGLEKRIRELEGKGE